MRLHIDGINRLLGLLPLQDALCHPAALVIRPSLRAVQRQGDQSEMRAASRRERERPSMAYRRHAVVYRYTYMHVMLARQQLLLPIEQPQQPHRRHQTHRGRANPADL